MTARYTVSNNRAEGSGKFGTYRVYDRKTKVVFGKTYYKRADAQAEVTRRNKEDRARRGGNK